MKVQNRVTALFVICTVSVVLLACWIYPRESVEPVAHGAALQSCPATPELENAVRKLSPDQTFREMEAAKLRLISSARVSAKCRTEVIGTIIKEMDKPQLQAYRDFNLWRYGANVLGDLKATESLDLLIRNLSFTDGSSINVTHYPAMEGVIKMGRPALPKLGAALRQNSDVSYRYNAVFCIAQIGGAGATAELKAALPSESDSCVRKFIEISIKALSNPKSPGRIGAGDRDA